MPVTIALVNLTNDEIRIDDLGTRLLGPSGTAFDITGFFLPEELRQSEDLAALAASGVVTLSGAEGLTPPSEIFDFLDGGQFQTQNFTTDGRDLRDLRNTVIEPGLNTVVASGVEEETGVVTYTVGTIPQVVTDAIVPGGDATVISGANTITVSDGPDVDSLNSFTGDVTIAGLNTITILNDSGTVTISGADGTAPGAVKNQIISLDFVSGGNEEWMAISDNDHGTDEHPYVCPWPLRILGMMYTNKKNNTRFRLRFYKAEAGSGSSNTQIFDWLVGSPGCRVAYKSDLGLNEATFEAGDKFALFLDDVSGGNDPDQPVVTVYLQVREEFSGSGTERFGGNF